jgi:hypothetical protein
VKRTRPLPSPTGPRPRQDRSAPLPLFGFCAIVAMLAALPGLAANVIDAPFLAPDRAHLRFDGLSPAAGTTAVRAVLGRGDERHILGSGSTEVHGLARLSGLSPGEWGAAIEATVVDSAYDPPRTRTNVLVSRSFTLRTNEIRGTLLVDESFEAPAGPALIVNLDGHALTVANGSLSAFAVEGAGSVSFRNLTLESEGAIGGALTEFDHCVVRSSTWRPTTFGALPAPAGRLTLRNSEFHAPVELLAARPLTLTENVFMKAVQFRGDGWTDTEVRFNSFYGLDALLGDDGVPPSNPIRIGANFFGDPIGPNAFAFGLHRGGTVQTYAFRVQAGAADRSQAYHRRFRPRDPALKAEIVRSEVRFGQNVATAARSATINALRPTLVTVDLVPNLPVVRGAKVYAKIGDTEYLPAAPAELHHDLGELTTAGEPPSRAAAAGALTCNIILPPDLPTTTNLFGTVSTEVAVFLDTTGITNYVSPGEPARQLASFTLYPVRYARHPLRILVAPVRFALTGSPITAKDFSQYDPDIGPTLDALRRFGPALLPLRAEEMTVVPHPYLRFGREQVNRLDAQFWTTCLLSLADFLQGELDSFNRSAAENPRLQFDRVIGVVPAGLLNSAGNKIEGFNANFSSTACVVDESKPLAALHELLHSFGINNLVEEYDYYGTPAYNSGYPMVDTAFLPEATLATGPQPDFARNLPRIYHFAAYSGFFNLMGCKYPIWINPDTLESLRGKLTFLTKAGSAAGSPALHAATPAHSPTPPGYRRILLTGQYTRSGSAWPFDASVLRYTLLPGTMAAEDVTGLFPNPIPSPNSGKSESFGFRMFDRTGAPIFTPRIPAILLSDPMPLESPTGHFRQTVDLPPETVRFRLEAPDGASPPLLEVDGAVPLDVRIVSPASGSTFAGPLAVVVAANKSNLIHRVGWRASGGTGDWSPILGSVRGTRFEIGAEFTEVPGTFDLRIRSSDGLSFVENTLTGLSVPDRSPRVEILSPAAAAAVGSFVSLVARATDPEDGPLTRGTWRSSAQGALGTGDALEVRLTPGPHRLVHAVTDHAGHAVEASVDVTVTGDAGGPDADPGTLEIVPAGRARPDAFLLVGFTNRITVRPWVASNDTATATLSVTGPDGVPRQLATDGSDAARERLSLDAPFAPGTTGDYVFAVALETPHGNLRRQWTVPAVAAGIRVFVEPAEALAAGAQWKLNDGPWRSSGEALPAEAWNTTERRISFKGITGWFTAQNIHLTRERTAVLDLVGQYRRNTGFLPWFDTQPKSQALDVGQRASFGSYVNASPSPVYQWFKDGQPIAGATRASYTIASVGLADAGTYSLLASNANGGAFSQPAILTLNGASPVDPFATWMAGYPVPANARGLADDPDGDGLPNVVEFALASDPGSPVSGPLTRADLVVDAGKTYLGFVYRRPKNAPHQLVFDVTASTALDPWDGLTARLVSVTDRGAYEEVLVRTPVAVEVTATGFIRMSVQYP